MKDYYVWLLPSECSLVVEVLNHIAEGFVEAFAEFVQCSLVVRVLNHIAGVLQCSLVVQVSYYYVWLLLSECSLVVEV